MNTQISSQKEVGHKTSTYSINFFIGPRLSLVQKGEGHVPEMPPLYPPMC